MQKNLQADWNAMLTNGLEADDSTAASRTQQMIQTWARGANINLEALTPEHIPSQKGPFQTINFSLDYNSSGNDSMRQIARLLSSVETAHIPMRLNSLQDSVHARGYGPVEREDGGLRAVHAANGSQRDARARGPLGYGDPAMKFGIAHIMVAAGAAFAIGTAAIAQDATTQPAPDASPAVVDRRNGDQPTFAPVTSAAV